MMLIINISRQPDANNYQYEQHGEREPVHDHAVRVIVLTSVDFEFSEIEYHRNMPVAVVSGLAPFVHSDHLGAPRSEAHDPTIVIA